MTLGDSLPRVPCDCTVSVVLGPEQAAVAVGCIRVSGAGHIVAIALDALLTFILMLLLAL